MDRISAKEYLTQLKDLDKYINAQQEELDRLRNMVIKISVSSRDMDVQCSSMHDKLGDTVAKIVDLDREITSCIDKYIDIKHDAVRIIAIMPDLKLRTVLYKYYILNKTFEQTAVEMEKSYQWICELHGKALQQFEKILNT